MKKKKRKNKLLRKKDIARFFLPSLVIVLALCLLGCILDNALGLTEYLFGSGEEAIKAELEEELREYKEKQRVMEHIGYDAGLRIPMIRELVQVTYQEAEERQLDLVCENLDLLFRMGFTHELKRCYSYVRKTLQSPEIMAEIDFSLMRSAVLSNELSFFYMDCPLPLDSLLRWWEEMIDERFDEAIVLWKEGRKDEAKRIRRDLFILFTQSLFYQLGNYDCTDEEMPEMQKYDVIRLMGRFVMRRTDAVGSYDSNGEPIELDKEWAESEKNMLDDEDQIRDAESLVSFAARTLDEWVAGNCSETINEWLEADACTLFQAEKF